MSTSTILVVDDQEMVRNLVRTKLSREGRHVLMAANGKEAIELFRRERPDITLLDLDMPDMNGIEVLKSIRHIDERAMVMVFTGTCADASLSEAKKLGVRDFLQKGPSLSSAWDARIRIA